MYYIIVDTSTIYSCKYKLLKNIGYGCQAVGCRDLLGRQNSFRIDLADVGAEGGGVVVKV